MVNKSEDACLTKTHLQIKTPCLCLNKEIDTRTRHGNGRVKKPVHNGDASDEVES